MVFVAVPAAAVTGVTRRVLRDEGRSADVVVTDVSGVKTTIVGESDHPRFIGGHPMAGSEQTGLSGADPDLFVGAVLGVDAHGHDRPRSLQPAQGRRHEPRRRRARALAG